MAMFDPGLEKDAILSNRQLMDIFHCACEGGIRYASKTDTLTLVVNNTKSGLPNVWRGDVLDFAGRILKDGKTLQGANRRLAEFLQAKKPIFLFEVNTPGQYRYLGKITAAEPYHLAHAAKGSLYPVFPLKILNGD